MTDDIVSLRERIDKIDEKILLLLKRRMEISKLIGKIKKEKGMAIRDLERENEKYKQLMEKAMELGLNQETIHKIYQNIIEMSLKSQEQSSENSTKPSHSKQI